MIKKSILFGFLLLFSIALANAESMCFPEGDPYCDLANPNSPCVCNDIIEIDDYFYCDIDDIVSCPNGCENGECVGGTPSCSNGAERCCASAEDCDEYDANGDAFRCVSGEWERIERCERDDICTEYGANEAVCEGERFYCMNNQIGECYWTDPSDGRRPNNCCDTLEQCRTNLINYCIAQDGSCTKRYGGCNSNEQFRQGTNIDDAWCASQGEEAKCESCWEWFTKSKEPEFENNPTTCNPNAIIYQEIEIPRMCVDKVVWKSDSFLGNLFNIEITQSQICPVYAFGIATVGIFIIIIIFAVVIYVRRKR